MKQQARTHHSRQIVDNLSASNGSDTTIPKYRPAKKDSIELLLNIWENVNQNQIQNAWNLAIYGREGATNDDV